MLERENYSENMMGFYGRMGVREQYRNLTFPANVGKERIIW